MTQDFNLEWPAREHVPGLDCWCEPLPHYRSQATGASFCLHPASDDQPPPPWVLAIARWHCDGETDHG